MGDVIELDSRRPHDMASMECACGRKWTAVYPAGTTHLKCPGCGAMVPVEEIPW